MDKRYSEELIQSFLYGYKEMRLVSSEDVLNALQKEKNGNGHRLPETPPLSPRKIRTPDEVSLCTSSIPGNKFGVCAVKRILHGTWFGPFEGKLVRTSEITGSVNTEYMWEIFHDGEVSHFLDGNENNCWMSIVRCARHKKEQNLVVFQYHGCIYYRTIKDVVPGTELLVWYDSKYTQLLGIPLTWNDSRSSNNKRKSVQSVDDAPKKRKISPIPLLQLQKMEDKFSPAGKRLNEVEKFAGLQHKKIDLPSPASSASELSLSLPIRCEKCLFQFHTNDHLHAHKCLGAGSSWLPSLRLPPIGNARENPFHRPIHINMPYTDPISFYQSYYQYLPSYHYPSPPMDPLRLLPTSVHKGAPIPIKNY